MFSMSITIPFIQTLLYMILQIDDIGKFTFFGIIQKTKHWTKSTWPKPHPVSKSNQPPILQAMPNFTNWVTFQHQHCVVMSQLENDVQAKQIFF